MDFNRNSEVFFGEEVKSTQLYKQFGAYQQKFWLNIQHKSILGKEETSIFFVMRTSIHAGQKPLLAWDHEKFNPFNPESKIVPN